jgi:hypothetical protein
MPNKEKTMSSTNKLRIALVAMAAVAMVTPVRYAYAETSNQSSAQVTRQLSAFKHNVSEMRREAEVLESWTRNIQLSWQSHVFSLNALKDHLNELGQVLAQLEGLRPLANDSQALAIEHARPHLVSVAQDLTQAIELVNESRRNIQQREYVDSVSNVYAHANALHTKLDAILAYQGAKARVDSLER